ncbi:MAG: lysophospholipid acyltransferase family protein [Chthoniobacteraceae bacterium]
MSAELLSRISWRAFRFVLALVYDLWRFFREIPMTSAESKRVARARWLHGCCQRALRVMHIHGTVEGTLPARGLIVANHLSYLDIVTLSAALPCVFVSKAEVSDWPLFGAFARHSGTLFLDRARRGAVGSVAAQMREILAEDLPLVIFPEGTSTNGDTMLPFKSSLFEPVAQLGCPVTAAAISYSIANGSVREEIHWWGTMPLLPHLLKVFAKRRIDVTIRFGEARVRTGDRKTIARELREEVSALRTVP